MKLCIVTHTVAKGDGQGRVNYEVTQEALQRGHHVTLVASNIAPELQQHPQVVWIPIVVKQLPSQLLKELAFSWQTATWLHYHRSEFDILQVNGAITTGSSHVNAAHFVHASWLQSPYHTSRQRRDAYSLYQWFYTALNAIREKRAFAQAQVVVAVSEKLKQELLKIGVPDDRIRVIVNGVDLQEFSPGFADRSQFGLPEGVPLALFVGDIRTNRKNLDTVLNALAQISDWHLAVIGRVEDSPYPEQVAQLSLDGRVHFLGYRREVPMIMRAVDLFVFPSRYEPFGMVITEAMATGLPVITAQTTGAAEIVTPECGVVLQNPEDATALAQTLQLLQNSHLRQQMGAVGRSIVEQYSWAQMAQSYVELFEELIQPC